MQYFTLKQEWKDYEPGIQYIYIIKNSTNDKCYIGKTKDITKIWEQHKTNIDKPDSKLYAAMRKIGIDKFEISQIAEVDGDPVFVNDVEDVWMNYYNSVKIGYNQSYNTNLLKKIKIETKHDIALAHFILQLPEMQLLGVWPEIRDKLEVVGVISEEEREVFFRDFYNKHKNNYRKEKVELMTSDLIRMRTNKIICPREELAIMLNEALKNKNLSGFTAKGVNQFGQSVTGKTSS